MKGTVKFFNTSKGFGFIKNDEDSNEYFVHVSGTNDEIKDNDKVTFELEDSDRGKRAVNVSLIKEVQDQISKFEGFAFRTFQSKNYNQPLSQKIFL